MADHALFVDLPNLERSPGIRTYQASLLGMLLTALRLAETRTPACPADRLREELTGLAYAVEATARAVRDRCRRVPGAPLQKHQTLISLRSPRPVCSPHG